MMKRILTAISIFCCSFSLHAQTIPNFEVGLIANPQDLYWDFSVRLGQAAIYDMLHTSAGIKFLNYRYIFNFEKENNPDKYEGVTQGNTSILFTVQSKFNIPLFVARDDNNKVKYRIGIFPEANVDFAPMLPYRFAYRNDNYEFIELKGKAQSGWGYGYGGGIFVGDEEAEFNLRVHSYHFDQFSELRKLDIAPAGVRFPKPPYIRISLGLVAKF